MQTVRVIESEPIGDISMQSLSTPRINTYPQHKSPIPVSFFSPDENPQARNKASPSADFKFQRNKTNSEMMNKLAVLSEEEK